MHFVLLFCLLLVQLYLIPPPGQTLQANEPDTEPIAIDKNQWTVGIARLAAPENNPAAIAAADTISGRIRSLLQDSVTRTLSSSDKQNLALAYQTQNINSTYATLESLYSQRDREFFNPTPPSKSQLRSTRNSIVQALEDLEKWQSLNPDSVSVPDQLPISLVQAENNANLLPASPYSNQALLATRNLDALIAGQLSSVGSYLGIRIVWYTKSTDHILYEGALDSSSLDLAIDTASSKARERLLGRPWAGLDLTVTPTQTSVRINGSVLGAGTYRNLSLTPGPLELELTSPGHSPQTQTLNLEENRILSLNLTLEQSTDKTLIVRSTPTGANLRLGNIWLGMTPYVLNIPQTISSLTFEKKGFRSRTLPITPDMQDKTLSVTLDVLGTPLDTFNSNRKKMQTSIILFSASLVPTLTLLGVSRNFSQRIPIAPTSSDRNEARLLYDITNGSMWGSIAINAGLLGLVIYRIINYLKSAEELSDY